MNDADKKRAIAILSRAQQYYQTYALDLLRSESVHWRLQGISRVLELSLDEAIPVLRELLDDDMPYLYQRGAESMIAEVRSRALVALQDLYRERKRPIDFGPVTVRRAMPASEAEARGAAAMQTMSEARRHAVQDEARAALERAGEQAGEQPPSLLAYRVLQSLGLVRYEEQALDPDSYLTPMQEAIYASQMASRRPVPHLRIAAPEDTRILGYVYRRADGLWVHDFSEHPDSRAARAAVERVLTSAQGGIPRLACDDTGQPLRGPSGEFVRAGVISESTPHTMEYLHSLAAQVVGPYVLTCVES